MCTRGATHSGFCEYLIRVHHPADLERNRKKESAYSFVWRKSFSGYSEKKKQRERKWKKKKRQKSSLDTSRWNEEETRLARLEETLNSLAWLITAARTHTCACTRLNENPLPSTAIHRTDRLMLIDSIDCLLSDPGQLTLFTCRPAALTAFFSKCISTGWYFLIFYLMGGGYCVSVQSVRLKHDL